MQCERWSMGDHFIVALCSFMAHHVTLHETRSSKTEAFDTVQVGQQATVIVLLQVMEVISGRITLLNPSLRWRSLAAGASLCCLMTSRLRCVRPINRPSAPSPTLRWPSLMQCTSTWENLRPSSSVRQVGSPQTATNRTSTLQLFQWNAYYIALWTQHVWCFFF